MILCIMNVAMQVECSYSLYCTSPFSHSENTMPYYNRGKSKGVGKSRLEMKAIDEGWGHAAMEGPSFRQD